ncbi:reverse transcriptase domain-containing protein [Tanacetum coccineum]
MNTTSRESVSKTDERIDKLADQLSTLVEIVSTKVVTPAPVKAVEEIGYLCRGFIDVYGEEITLRVDNEAVTFKLDQTTRYSSTNDKSVNRIDIIDAVCEEYAPELLGFSNNDSSGGNPTPTSEPFTSEFILEEIKAYLKDDSISPEIDYADCDPEEDICKKLLSHARMGTFAVPSHCHWLCNAPGTFQRCMMAIFHDMIEKTVEVFMDDFSVFGDSFDSCLSNLEKMLKRCEDTNLVLNWEKCHFMCREGIVLDIKFQSRELRPMTHLLEKETLFVFSKDCIDAFQTLKKKLTEAPILVVVTTMT